MVKTLNFNLVTKRKQISYFLLGIFIMYFSVTALTNKRFNDIEQNFRTQISEQIALITFIAETTSRNSGDEITDKIVKDCSVNERNSFDKLLGKLNDNLTRSELTELERLFDRCGSFFSDRKTVMVSRLLREIDIYENYVKQLSVILGESVEEKFSVSKWQELGAEERKQSELFARLVALQQEIIITLLAGYGADSSKISSILSEVKEVQDNLSLAKEQASKVRAELI